MADGHRAWELEVMTMKKIALVSVAGLGLAGASFVPAQAAVQGTSDTVITCEGAHEFDPENYHKPGFICEVDPDSVKVGGQEFAVIRYTLLVRQGKKKVVESKPFEYGFDPAPVYFSAKDLKAGVRYNVDYKAVIDDGRVVTVSDDDFFLKVPGAPGKVSLKVKYAKLSAGTGKGYVLKWPAAKRAHGYVAQVKANGKWKALPLSGKRSAEFGRAEKSPGKFSFRVRSWNEGGYGTWATAMS